MGWLIALGILILLAILPLGASVRFDADGLVLRVISGWIRIPILPSKKKDTDNKKSKKEKKKPEKQKINGKNAQKKSDSTQKKEKGGSITDFLPLPAGA